MSKTESTTDQSKWITVRGALEDLEDGGSKVSLFELDERHPNGSAFVAGSTPVLVYPTARVRESLAEGLIQQV